MSAKIMVLALASSAVAALPVAAFAQAMPSEPIPYSQFSADYDKGAKSAEHHAHHMAHKAHHDAMKASDDATAAADASAQGDEHTAKAATHAARKMASRSHHEAMAAEHNAAS